MRKVAGANVPPKIFAEAERKTCRFFDNVVQIAGFLPQPELACLNVARHAFRGGPDESQFVIVNGPAPFIATWLMKPRSIRSMT